MREDLEPEFAVAMDVMYLMEALTRAAMVMQQKTRRPVQFELTDQARDALAVWHSRKTYLHTSHCGSMWKRWGSHQAGSRSQLEGVKRFV